MNNNIIDFNQKVANFIFGIEMLAKSAKVMINQGRIDKLKLLFDKFRLSIEYRLFSSDDIKLIILEMEKQIAGIKFEKQTLDFINNEFKNLINDFSFTKSIPIMELYNDTKDLIKNRKQSFDYFAEQMGYYVQGVYYIDPSPVNDLRDEYQERITQKVLELKKR